MITTLGIDWAADFAEEFADELYACSFTKTVVGAYNVNDPSGPPAQTKMTYNAKGIAFSYAEGFVDGEQVKQATYKVLMLLATIETTLGVPAPGIVPNPGDTVSIAPPDQAVPMTATVVGISSITQASVTVEVRGQPL